VSTGADSSESFSQPVAVSYGAWILIADSPPTRHRWQLSHDVPGPEGMFAVLNVPTKPTSLELLDAIRSIDAEAPSVELVEKFIHVYPSRVLAGA
jgi:hypothetical protein